MRVQSLGQEDPLEEEMASPLQNPCLKNSMDGGAWGVTVHGSQRVRQDRATGHAFCRNIKPQT